MNWALWERLRTSMSLWSPREDRISARMVCRLLSLFGLACWVLFGDLAGNSRFAFSSWAARKGEINLRVHSLHVPPVCFGHFWICAWSK